MRTAAPPPGFLRFLERIDASAPADLDVHLVIDNYATDKHGAVRVARRAAPLPRARHAQVRVGPQPGRVLVRLVTQRAIRRASVHPTQQLVRRIEAFVTACNATARPFAWTATSASILAKLEPLLKAISGTRH